MFTFKFTPEGDYKEELTAYTDELFRNIKKKTEDKKGIAERNQIVETLTDTYIEVTGERPPSYALSRLTNYVLHDVLTDKRTNKSSDENAVLSRHQIKKRKRDEVNNDELIGNIDSKSRRCNRTRRRQRSLYENMYVDGDLKHLKPQDFYQNRAKRR